MIFLFLRLVCAVNAWAEEGVFSVCSGQSIPVGAICYLVILYEGYVVPKARQSRQIWKLYDTHALVSPLPQNANWWKFLIWPTGLCQAYQHKIWCTHTHTQPQTHTGNIHKKKLEAPTLTDLRAERRDRILLWAGKTRGSWFVSKSVWCSYGWHLAVRQSVAT